MKTRDIFLIDLAEGVSNKWNGVTESYDLYQKILMTLSFIFIEDKYNWYNTPCIKFYTTVFNFIFLLFLQLQTNTVTTSDCDL